MDTDKNLCSPVDPDKPHIFVRNSTSPNTKTDGVISAWDNNKPQTRNVVKVNMHVLTRQAILTENVMHSPPGHALQLRDNGLQTVQGDVKVG